MIKMVIDVCGDDQHPAIAEVRIILGIRLAEKALRGSKRTCKKQQGKPANKVNAKFKTKTKRLSGARALQTLRTAAQPSHLRSMTARTSGREPDFKARQTGKPTRVCVCVCACVCVCLHILPSCVCRFTRYMCDRRHECSLPSRPTNRCSCTPRRSRPGTRTRSRTARSRSPSRPGARPRVRPSCARPRPTPLLLLVHVIC